MRVVLLAINAKYAHSALSVWQTAAGVARYSCGSHAVTVVEATIAHQACDIAEQVAAHRPDVVAISTYIWNAPVLPELLSILRSRLPGAALVLGGPEASHNEEHWLRLGADTVLRGEGERALPAYLDGGERYVPQRTSQIEEYWCDPYTEEYLATLKGRIAYIETSRGCPFRCAFCLSGGSGVQFLPMTEAKSRIEKLAHSGAKTLKFVDRTFNCNAERARELFEFAAGLETPCVFHFEVAPDLFEPRTLRLLSSVPPGKFQLEAGLQSYHQPALEASSRSTDIAKAEHNLKELLRPGNIHIHLDLIAGLPGEGLSQFRDSFDRAYSLGAHNLQLGFLKLFHGTKLREQAESLAIEYSPEPPYEILRSPWLSAEDLAILKNAENALRHTSNKCRFMGALRYVLQRTGIRPFELFRIIGEAAPNHGTPLDTYAEQLHGIFAELLGGTSGELLDAMNRDWLGMVKGKNFPLFLKKGKHVATKAIASAAEVLLGHKATRGEVVVLRSGEAVCVNAQRKDPVTGLYEVRAVD